MSSIVLDALQRSAELMDATMRFVRENANAAEMTVHYDGVECDGYCLGDDCESNLEQVQRAIAELKGKS